MKTLALLVSSALMFMNVESNWIQLPGALKQLDSDGTMTCGVDSANDFYCRKDTFSDWVLQ
jgi:hypothetical protein